jgi:hypothetical protein
MIRRGSRQLHLLEPGHLFCFHVIFSFVSFIFAPEFINNKIMKDLVANLNQLFADFTKDATAQVENGNNYVN